MPAYRGEHEDAIIPFVDAMRAKLAMNKHKGRWEDLDLPAALKRLREETDELEEAIARGNTVEVLLEAADIGNFAMMVANIAIKQAMGGKGSEAAPPASLTEIEFERDATTEFSPIGATYKHKSGRVERFSSQGCWSPAPQVNIKMWKSENSGIVYYDDHPMARTSKLPIVPWATSNA